MCAAARALAPAAGQNTLSCPSAKPAPCPAVLRVLSGRIWYHPAPDTLLPLIKVIKLCHGLNSAVAAKFFPHTLNCPDLGMP